MAVMPRTSGAASKTGEPRMNCGRPFHLLSIGGDCLCRAEDSPSASSPLEVENGDAGFDEGRAPKRRVHSWGFCLGSREELAGLSPVQVGRRICGVDMGE